jgi:hypothetical protein
MIYAPNMQSLNMNDSETFVYLRGTTKRQKTSIWFQLMQPYTNWTTDVYIKIVSVDRFGLSASAYEFREDERETRVHQSSLLFFRVVKGS